MESFVLTNLTSMIPYSKGVLDMCAHFDCGEDDMDDFFLNDASLYEEELLGKTYCFVTEKKPRRIVAMFTVANDSIKTTHLGRTTTNRINRPIDNAKRGRSYPATLIGRIGVNSAYQKKGYHIGTQVLDFLKAWYTDVENKNGCRFLVVDAYNREDVLRFYEKNGFKYLHRTEEEERSYYHIEEDAPIRTRLMYFDLKKVM